MKIQLLAAASSSVCRDVRPSVRLVTCLSTCLSTCLPTCLSTSLVTCLSTSLSACLPTKLPTNQLRKATATEVRRPSIIYLGCFCSAEIACRRADQSAKLLYETIQNQEKTTLRRNCLQTSVSLNQPKTQTNICL